MTYFWDPWNWAVFILVILAILAITLVVLGVMTAYFGTGKSRTVGVILFAAGIVIGILTIFVSLDYFKPQGGLIQSVIVPTFFYVAAVAIGAVIGLLIFLGAIMKT